MYISFMAVHRLDSLYVILPFAYYNNDGILFNYIKLHLQKSTHKFNITGTHDTVHIYLNTSVKDFGFSTRLGKGGRPSCGTLPYTKQCFKKFPKALAGNFGTVVW